MIVVVLAVVWVVALTPMVLRRISERQFTAGVRNYHRRLLRLSSAGQAVAAPELVQVRIRPPVEVRWML